MRGEKLRVVPLTLKESNRVVDMLHRHHKPVVGHRFSLGVVRESDVLAGAAICGRPVARKTPQYKVLEVSRLTTDGTKNACSILYAACARAAEAMGFESIQTFILDSEPGTSLKAAGWERDEELRGGGDWNVPSRGGRRTDQPMGKKVRWFKKFKVAS